MAAGPAGQKLADLGGGGLVPRDDVRNFLARIGSTTRAT